MDNNKALALFITLLILIAGITVRQPLWFILFLVVLAVGVFILKD